MAGVENSQPTVAGAAVADVHISDVPFSDGSPLPFEPSEDDFAWARDHPGQWKYFAHGAAERTVKPSDVVGAVLADDKGGFTEVWWNPELMPPESTRAQLANDFEVAVWKFVQGDSTLGHFVEAFADSEVILLLSEDDPAGERWSVWESGGEWWLDLYTSPGRVPEDVDPQRQRTVLGRALIERAFPLDRVHISFKSGTSPEAVILSSDFVTAWRQLREVEKVKPASGVDDNTHLEYLHRVMGSGWSQTPSEQPPQPEVKPEPKLQTGDLSRLAAREVLHIADKTRTKAQILPEPGEKEFAWARANPGEWKYYADPRVAPESFQRRNMIGGRRAGEDGGFAEIWLNPAFVPTEGYSGWEFANEFEVVVWRLTFGFNTVGHFIDAFSRSEFILLRSADDPAAEQQWPLVRNRLGDLNLTIYSSAAKLPADTNPMLRRVVSGLDVLEQVCPMEDAWVLINVHAAPYQELSGANLLRWWREWQAAQGLPPTAEPGGE